MAKFTPNYQYVVDAAYNREAERPPLYDHLVDTGIMEKILGTEFRAKFHGNTAEVEDFFANYCNFFAEMGYDTVSYEECVGGVLPGGGALGDSSITPVIGSQEDFENYPWDEIPAMYAAQNYPRFDALTKVMPEGMKAVGGVGNGVFECVQDLVGFENLCYFSVDNPELYANIFKKMGEVLNIIWGEFLEKYHDTYCVMRFGDDLGYKSNTLLSAEDIRQHIIPVYKGVIDQVHSYNRPFLLHSCGQIFDVMDDLIAAGIDAKHSNEDQIAPFIVWMEEYGDRIGNFGGIDTDAVCRLPEPEMEAYIEDVYTKSKGKGGFAFGSGNSIPHYVPLEQYLMMNKIFRNLRGESI